MKLKLLLPLYLFSQVVAWASEPLDYYASLSNQTGAALRLALHSIIKNHAALAYSPTRDALAATDEDPANANNVLLIYSRRSEPKTNFAINGNATTWNREHLWPNSLGIDSVEPAYSDLFNLRPADLDVNNRRGNLFYDETNFTPGNATEGVGTADVEAPLCTKDNNSWEVPATVKGDIARSMFYMDIRYEGDKAGEPDLILTDKLSEITSTGNKFGRLTTLLLWSLSDPVDDAERTRNDRVFARQGNRNPFVDRPDLVSQLYENPLEMKVTVSGNQLKLLWAESLSTSAPQKSSNLSQWQDLPAPYVLEGTHRTLLIPISVPSTRQYFRLPYKKPDVP